VPGPFARRAASPKTKKAREADRFDLGPFSLGTSTAPACTLNGQIQRRGVSLNLDRRVDIEFRSISKRHGQCNTKRLNQQKKQRRSEERLRHSALSRELREANASGCRKAQSE
jgi:hypothetical protein